MRVRLTPEEEQVIQSYAKQRGVPVSVLVNQALEVEILGREVESVCIS